MEASQSLSADLGKDISLKMGFDGKMKRRRRRGAAANGEDGLTISDRVRPKKASGHLYKVPFSSQYGQLLLLPSFSSAQRPTQRWKILCKGKKLQGLYV